ncbi:MAG: phage tail protein [Neomegalonema sp.]
MPAVAVAAVGAAATAIAGSGVLTGAVALGAFLTSTSFLVPVALSVAGSLLQGAFAPKPPKFEGPQPEDITRTVRQATAARRKIYGKRRTGGVFVFLSSTGSKNKFLHMVIVWASHEVQSINKLFFNDDEAWTPSEGFKGKYSGYATIENRLGEADQVAFPGLVDATGGVPGSGGSLTLSSPASIAVDTVQKVRNKTNRFGDDTVTRTYTASRFTADPVPGATRYRFEYKGGGDYSDTTGWSARESDTNVYSDFSSTVDASLIRVTVRDSDGKWSAFRQGDGAETDPLPLWTENHKLNGIACSYIRLEYDQDVYGGGIPNITAEIDGAKLFDPRSGLTEYSANSALAVRDYLTDAQLGLGVSQAEIDDNSIIAAANLADEPIDLLEGGTEPRYECHGVVDTSARPDSVLEALLISMGGAVSYSGGQFGIVGSAYSPPVLDLTDDDLVGGVTIQPRREATETFNAVKGVFASAEDNWIETDYPVQRSTLFATEDGREIFTELDLPFTTSNTMAQRLAKVALLRSRQQLTVPGAFKLKATRLRAGAVVRLTIARYGWNAVEFEVMEWSFQLQPNGEVGVVLALREIAASVFDWTTDDELPFVPTQKPASQLQLAVTLPEGLAAQTQNVLVDEDVLPGVRFYWTPDDDLARYEISWSTGGSQWQSAVVSEPFHVVGGISLEEIDEFRIRGISAENGFSDCVDGDPIGALSGSYHPVPTGVSALTAGGATVPVLTLSWDDPGGVDGWVVGIRRPGGNWERQTNSQAVSTIDIPLTDPQDGTYFARVAAVRTTSEVSDWTVVAITIAGASKKPGAVTGFAIQVVGDQAILRWNDLGDFVSHYEIRQSPLTSGAEWNSSVQIAEDIADTQVVVSALAGSYLIKAVSVLGSYSDDATIITSETSSLAALNVVQVQAEAPGWAGDRDAVAIQSGRLRLVEELLLTDITDLSAVDDISGGFLTLQTGTYATGVIDLGEVFTTRLSYELEAFGIEDGEGIIQITDLAAVVDMAPQIGDGWSVVVQVRTSQDGTTWSDWISPATGDFTARAFQFRLVLSNTVAGITPSVGAFTITLDMPDRVEGEADIAVPDTGLTVLYGKPFRDRPALAIDAQSLASGDRKEITAQSASGFTVRFYDSSGTPISTTIDWIAKGYGARA